MELHNLASNNVNALDLIFKQAGLSSESSNVPLQFAPDHPRQPMPPMNLMQDPSMNLARPIYHPNGH